MWHLAEFLRLALDLWSLANLGGSTLNACAALHGSNPCSHLKATQVWPCSVSHPCRGSSELLPLLTGDVHSCVLKWYWPHFQGQPASSLWLSKHPKMTVAMTASCLLSRELMLQKCPKSGSFLIDSDIDWLLGSSQPFHEPRLLKRDEALPEHKIEQVFRVALFWLAKIRRHSELLSWRVSTGHPNKDNKDPYPSLTWSDISGSRNQMCKRQIYKGKASEF